MKSCCKHQGCTVLDGGESEPNNEAAAAHLGQGHPKSGKVPPTWNMKDVSKAGQAYTKA